MAVMTGLGLHKEKEGFMGTRSESSRVPFGVRGRLPQE